MRVRTKLSVNIRVNFMRLDTAGQMGLSFVCRNQARSDFLREKFLSDRNILFLIYEHETTLEEVFCHHVHYCNIQALFIVLSCQLIRTVLDTKFGCTFKGTSLHDTCLYN